jgi:hypothetical protein
MINYLTTMHESPQSWHLLLLCEAFSTSLTSQYKLFYSGWHDIKPILLKYLHM